MRSSILVILIRWNCCACDGNGLFFDQACGYREKSTGTIFLEVETT